MRDTSPTLPVRFTIAVQVSFTSFFYPRNSTVLNDPRLFFLVPLSNVEFTDSTVGTQPFSRSGSAKCRQRVESCSLKNPRSFRICGYIRTLSETIKPITLALFISLFSTLPPFSPLSFSLSYTHFLTLHSHSLSPAHNSHHSDPIPTLARSFASRTPVFSRLSFLLPFALPFSFRSLIVFFYSGNDTDTLHYA